MGEKELGNERYWSKVVYIGMMAVWCGYFGRRICALIWDIYVCMCVFFVLQPVKRVREKLV